MNATERWLRQLLVVIKQIAIAWTDFDAELRRHIKVQGQHKASSFDIEQRTIYSHIILSSWFR